MEKLSELLLQLRYYGNLRFAMLAVLAAVTAGLLTAFFRDAASGGYRVVLALFGGGVTVLFTCLQLKLGAAHQGLVEYLRQLAAQSSDADKHQGLVEVLLGQNIEHGFDAFLAKLKAIFLSIPGVAQFVVPAQGNDTYLGPVNMLVLLLHWLTVVLWLCLVLLALFG